MVARHANDFSGTSTPGHDVQAMLIRAAHVSTELQRLGTLYDSLAVRVAQQEAATQNARPGPAFRSRGENIAKWHAIERESMLVRGVGERVRDLLTGQRRDDAQEGMTALIGRLAMQCELNAQAIERLRTECDDLRAMSKQQPSRLSDEE